MMVVKLEGVGVDAVRYVGVSRRSNDAALHEYVKQRLHLPSEHDLNLKRGCRSGVLVTTTLLSSSLRASGRISVVS
jgi:hypothetical protein